MKRNKKLKLGQNTLNGRSLYLEPADLQQHFLTVGGTGRGKSKLLESICRHHLRDNHGVLLLDPHGSLYEDVLAYATRAGFKDRVVLVNPNDTEHAVGLNFLAPNGMDVSAQASQVMKAIAKVFGESDSAVKPRLERWQRNLLISLIEAKLTMADMLDFLSASSPLYRDSVLHSVSNDYVRSEWQTFNAIKKREERENLIEAPLNRAAKMILSDPIRRIIGQEHSTVDMAHAIEAGKIVLVNLAPLKVSRECQQILGILLVDQIINCAFQRTKRQARKPFFVMVDEAAELTSDDLPYSLQALRKFGVYFTLCYQTLAQIKRIPGYYENVMTNCDLKVVFKSSRQDSEELIGELFAGQIHGNKVKDEIHRTMLIPRETVREIVSYSHGSSTSSGESYSSGASSGMSSTHGETMTFGAGPADSWATSQSESMSESYGSMSALGSMTNSTESESETRAVVPFYEFIREQELSNRQYYTIEEIKEKYIAWVMCQPQRHCQIKVRDEKAVPIMTTFVKEARAREKDKQKLVDRSNQCYALPAIEADKLIERRRLRLLQGDSVAEAIEIEVEEIENSKWQ